MCFASKSLPQTVWLNSIPLGGSKEIDMFAKMLFTSISVKWAKYKMEVRFFSVKGWGQKEFSHLRRDTGGKVSKK